MNKVFFEEKTKYDAIFQLVKKDFPELDKATVIISDYGDDVLVAVKAIFYNTSTEEGSVFLKPEQVGEYCRISKSAPITMLFDGLREMLTAVSAIVEDEKNGRLHEDVKA